MPGGKQKGQFSMWVTHWRCQNETSAEIHLSWQCNNSRQKVWQKFENIQMMQDTFQILSMIFRDPNMMSKM